MNELRSEEPTGWTGEKALASGIEAGKKGYFQEALCHFDEAAALAEELNDPRLSDRIICNRSVAEFELGRIDEPRQKLRGILVGSSDPENRFLAAYCIARSYDLQKDYKRALFYVRIARDRCLHLNRPDWLAWCHNLNAVVLLSTSYFEEACEEFELALKLMPFEPTVERAIILDNLGYCRLIQARYQEGFSLLYESLRMLLRCGAKRQQTLPRLSLCFGYLEVGKYRHALRHAQISLQLAEEAGNEQSIKYAHYLLGETYNQLGDSELALESFTRLQEKYYPDAPHVPELLLTMDVRQLINLKA